MPLTSGQAAHRVGIGVGENQPRETFVYLEGLGKKILQLRLKSKKTQRQVFELTGVAISYLSRLENGHTNPSVGTLSKISDALGVPLSSFFKSESVLEQGERCSVSPSGRCILDQPFVRRGGRPKRRLESYSPQHLKTLRMCNVLVERGDSKIVGSLCTLIESLLVAAESREGVQYQEILEATV